ncbi:hypothetical protein B0H11DRAFT_2317798 [Mycena galericulata]|nr:hypothetical protein B0H11DRAFT_2317798 [Mycena galericulata]
MYSRCPTQAKDAGWPISIDFDDLPPRISAPFPSLFHSPLSPLIVLALSPVWNKFLARIGYKVFAFSRSSNRFNNGNLGCGQYDLQRPTQLYLNSLTRPKGQPWDLYDETSNRISPRKFSKFILVPHVAACLIAEDLEITLNDTVEVLESSSEYGRLFNGDLPEKVDIVLAVNPESSQHPRHRKSAVNLKKDVEKPKKSKSPKKSKEKGKAEVKIPAVHGYGTRGAKTTT